jgi:hypothetical protein
MDPVNQKGKKAEGWKIKETHNVHIMLRAPTGGGPKVPDHWCGTRK